MDSLSNLLAMRTGLLSVRDFACVLKKHTVTIRNEARAGIIPSIRDGGRWKFDPIRVAAWLRAREVV